MKKIKYLNILAKTRSQKLVAWNQIQTKGIIRNGIIPWWRESF